MDGGGGQRNFQTLERIENKENRVGGERKGRERESVANAAAIVTTKSMDTIILLLINFFAYFKGILIFLKKIILEYE